MGPVMAPEGVPAAVVVAVPVVLLPVVGPAVAAVRYGLCCGWYSVGTVDSFLQHLRGLRWGLRTWQHRLCALNGSVAPTRPRQQRATLP